MSTVPCIGCGGSSKVMVAHQGANVKMGPCGLCGGTGTIDSELANGLIAAQDLQLGEPGTMKAKKYQPPMNRQLQGEVMLKEEQAMKASEPDTGDEMALMLQSAIDSEDPKAFRHLADQLERFQNPGVKGALLRAGKTVGKIGFDSLKTAAAVKANAQIVGAAHKYFPEYTSDPRVAMALPILLPLMLMFGVPVGKELGIIPESIPDSILDGLETAGGYAFKGISEPVAKEIAAKALPFFMEIAKIGAGLATGKMVIAPLVDSPDELKTGEAG